MPIEGPQAIKETSGQRLELKCPHLIEKRSGAYYFKSTIGDLQSAMESRMFRLSRASIGLVRHWRGVITYLPGVCSVHQCKRRWRVRAPQECPTPRSANAEDTFIL